MPLSTDTISAASVALPPSLVAAPAAVQSTPGFQVIRRNGSVSPFDKSKIAVAMTKAFLAVEGNSAAASRRVHEIVEQLTEEVVASLTRRAETGRTLHIEDVQDRVEVARRASQGGARLCALSRGAGEGTS
jgi:ribonucleoside-diphosphate reductase alpha chain